MSQEQKNVSFKDYITIHRNEIIITYDNAKETALKSYDDLTKRLDEQFKINEALKLAAEKNPVKVKPAKDVSRNKKK